MLIVEIGIMKTSIHPNIVAFIDCFMVLKSLWVVVCDQRKRRKRKRERERGEGGRRQKRERREEGGGSKQLLISFRWNFAMADV
jgi:hypothetical protein